MNKNEFLDGLSKSNFCLAPNGIWMPTKEAEISVMEFVIWMQVLVAMIFIFTFFLSMIYVYFLISHLIPILIIDLTSSFSRLQEMSLSI